MDKIIGDSSTLVTLSGDEVKDICKLGQGDKCCAFIVMSPTGFECIKMGYPANVAIHKRLKEGTMNAKGEGGWKDCAWEDDDD